MLNWLNYLHANEPQNSLQQVFENEKYSVFTLMSAMDNFFRMRDEISVLNERGDRLRISETDGSSVNVSQNNDGQYDLSSDAYERIIKFMKILSNLTGWEYREENWTWRNFILHKFTKNDFSKYKLSVCNRNYDQFIEKMPLTWAMTSNQNIEYTLEMPGSMV